MWLMTHLFCAAKRRWFGGSPLASPQVCVQAHVKHSDNLSCKVSRTSSDTATSDQDPWCTQDLLSVCGCFLHGSAAKDMLILCKRRNEFSPRASSASSLCASNLQM